MKKLLMLLGVALLTFGCMGPQGPQGPQGPAGEGSMKFTLEYRVLSRDWVRNTDAAGNFIGWWYQISVPELTKYIYEYGTYNAYLWDGNVQVPLPVIVYNETDNKLWEKKISCDFAVGSVAVYYQENDFANDGRQPEDMTFRIQMVW